MSTNFFVEHGKEKTHILRTTGGCGQIKAFDDLHICNDENTVIGNFSVRNLRELYEFIDNVYALGFFVIDEYNNKYNLENIKKLIKQLDSLTISHDEFF